MTKKVNKQRGITPDPAETSRDSQQHQQKAREGDFRDADRTANNTSYFDDDYKSGKKDDMEKGGKKEDRGKTSKR